MRFQDLTGLTSLPIDRIGHRFRNEDVLTVLPVSGAVPRYDAILVATPSDLVVLGDDGEPESEEWITQWAGWQTVRLRHTDDIPADAEPAVHGLTIQVGVVTFEARLSGPDGLRALRDFVLATQECQSVPATYGNHG